MSEFHRLKRSMGNLIARGVVAAVNAATKMQSLQMRLMADETKSDVEHFEPYGWSSNPHAGSEGIALFPDGDRSHGFVVVVADRRYRLTGMQGGEVAVHDDLGQKVHLTRDGIVIDGAGLPMIFTNTPNIRMETDQLEVTGEIKDRCDSTGKTMSGMRQTYNNHHHNETQSVTLIPNEQM